MLYCTNVCLGIFLGILASGFASAQDVVRIFPGTASAKGAGDAFFVTDVRLYNSDSDRTITVMLSFLDRDKDNTGAVEFPVDILPRQGVAFNDVLATFFGLSEATGAVRMRSSDLFYATSRTYNVGGEAGTFGSFIPGLRPGKRTADYLERVMGRITYVGASFLAMIAVIPSVVAVWLNISFAVSSFLGGTGLLIVVSVSLDLVQRIEANLVMRNYKGFLSTD